MPKALPQLLSLLALSMWAASGPAAAIPAGALSGSAGSAPKAGSQVILASGWDDEEDDEYEPRAYAPGYNDPRAHAPYERNYGGYPDRYGSYGYYGSPPIVAYGPSPYRPAPLPAPPPPPPAAYEPGFASAPPRPASCGKYRYWNGDYCADARWERPYVGPRW